MDWTRRFEGTPPEVRDAAQQSQVEIEATLNDTEKAGLTAAILAAMELVLGAPATATVELTMGGWLRPLDDRTDGGLIVSITYSNKGVTAEKALQALQEQVAKLGAIVGDDPASVAYNTLVSQINDLSSKATPVKGQLQ